jgi:hypothetical protein
VSAKGSIDIDSTELDKLFDDVQEAITQTNNWWQHQRSESLGGKVELRAEG